jgi:iron complex outermembrane receptor protein
VNDDVMLYGTVSNAYKTGGYNGEPQTAADAVTPYNEETAMNYEIGMKSEWFERLRLNISGFYVKYEDMQVSTFRRAPAGFTTQVIANASEAEVYGVELDFIWQINEYFMLSGTFARLDAELLNTCLPPEAGPTNCTAAGGLAGVDIDGNRPNNVPDWTATLVGEVEFPLNNGSRISLRADWRGRSSINNDVFNDPLLLRPGTDIIGARAAWTSADEKWQVTLWGKNLTEEADVLNIGPLPPYLNDNPVGFGPPRTFGGTVSYKFD